MALIQFGTVTDNLITLVVLLGAFYLIYAAMKETKIKQSKRDDMKKLFERDKE